MNAAALIPALILGALAAAFWPDFKSWMNRRNSRKDNR